MQLRYNYRVYPTPGQQVLLARAFGCARVVYNDALRARRDAYVSGEKISDTEVQRRVVTEAKKTPKRAWLGDIASVALVQACQDARLIKDAAGRYFASFVVQVTEQPLPETGSEVGIDLGLTTFAVLSTGKTIASPRFLRHAERRLRKAQQSLSRKEKGSKNRAKARVRVAKAHARVADTRRDWAHKHSTTIVRDNQAIFVEDLAVSGLARTRLAKSVHDAGWGMFTRMLEEKAARYGRTFAKVDRWFPSTRMCSVCGVLSGKKPLHVRKWTCTCGTVHDRDLNAAENILAAGRAERLNACGGAVSPAA
ncbi:RNA-guided endonuclease InsQ/TnpB family protein [Nocardia fusca]|uniref:RNA-guided endonuclease InsQ/TnpB family protein n=1 Tax=Nocardia fusca TaxID=941183 RepID=UPI0007A7552B|nr:RNA-guided endonuclease TnpB family protein [Nocardia fusca]